MSLKDTPDRSGNKTQKSEGVNSTVTIPLTAALTMLEDFDGERLVKTAVPLPELVRQTNNFSIKNRPGCQPVLLDSNPKELFLHYKVTCNLPESDPAGHDVRLQFDVDKVQETHDAKDLDVQLNCGCEAFLYWAPQWNLHQRDSLLGPARPLLQAPKERLDLRGRAVICKHIKAVAERVLPSVQHNITNILRKKEVERRKEELEKLPERLKEKQDKMKERRQQEKILNTKDEKIKQKLIDSLQEEEEARLLHEKKLEEGIPEEEKIQRTEPATEPKEPAPKSQPEEITEPAPKPEETELEAIDDLTKNEEKKIEQLHKEHKPHIHKGLPYEVEDEDTDENF